MLSYIENFSQSFMMAIIFWPILSMILTLPLMLIQLVWFKKITFSRTVVTFLAVLYGLALLAFTMYPFPDNMSEFCLTNHLTPQLNPLGFINDITSSGLKAVFQIVLNISFFVPLGVFLRNFAGMKSVKATLTCALVSLLIEVLQLTGVFGLFECSYRLFDVCDIIFNTLGGLLGYLLAMMLPNLSRKQDATKELNVKPIFVERLVTFWADMLVAQIIGGFVMIAIRLCGVEINEQIETIISVSLFGLLQFVLPLVWHGKTIMSNLANISLDDKQRTTLNRVLLYGIRAILLGLMMFYHGLVAFLAAMTLAIYYATKHKPPYYLIDKLFDK